MSACWRVQKNRNVATWGSIMVLSSTVLPSLYPLDTSLSSWAGHKLHTVQNFTKRIMKLNALLNYLLALIPANCANRACSCTALNYRAKRIS